ncbi:hypothetical protein Agub_g13934, partial [Astrephomene gubernaculifera]
PRPPAKAHTIKNPRAKWSQAAARLKAERKWAVTGTPIQNRLADLYGLMSYLRLEPLYDKSIFSRVLERPLKAGDPRVVKKLQVLMGCIAMRRTKDLKIGGRPLVVLPSKRVNLVTVHLNREDRAKYDALELQGRRLVSHALASSSLLENYMSVLEIILRLRQVADAGCLCPRDPLPLTLSQEGGSGSSRGRGGAPAPPLSPEETQLLAGLLAAGLQDDCPICLEPLSASACCITRCRHIFCRPCLENVIARSAGPGCPLCRAPLHATDLVDLPPATGDGAAAGAEQQQAGSAALCDPEAASAKVAALMRILRAAAAGEEGQGQGAGGGGGAEAGGSGSAEGAAAAVAPAGPADAAGRVAEGGAGGGGGGAGGKGPIKSVVFSQFSGMLDLVAAALSAARLPYVRLDGSTPARERAEAVRRFDGRGADTPLVFLASLKAGGVGMNLTAASHVHLLDPWWNPAVEEQAMDRVHRLGQTRDVEVYRYVAADTIEERMLLLQERKRQLAAAAFDRRSAEGEGRSAQMRIDDVKLLMDL